MKVSIILEEKGNGHISVKCDPPVWQLKKRAQGGVNTQLIGLVGLMLKSFFKIVPRKEQASMQGDDQAFASAVDIQTSREVSRSKILRPDGGHY